MFNHDFLETLFTDFPKTFRNLPGAAPTNCVLRITCRGSRSQGASFRFPPSNIEMCLQTGETALFWVKIGLNGVISGARIGSWGHAGSIRQPGGVAVKPQDDHGVGLVSPMCLDGQTRQV